MLCLSLYSSSNNYEFVVDMSALNIEKPIRGPLAITLFFPSITFIFLNSVFCFFLFVKGYILHVRHVKYVHKFVLINRNHCAMF